MKTLITDIYMYKTYIFIERKDKRHSENRMLRIYGSSYLRCSRLTTALISLNESIIYHRPVPYPESE